MKITDRCSTISITFGELEVGTVFRDSEGDIMMKINPTTYSDATNCVRLSDGEGFNLIDDSTVNPILEIELVIG